MNKEDFLNILTHPELIKNKQAFDLRSIVDQYPYFQSARSLYLKALKEQESFLYNHELKKTAAYITNRNVLFKFITSELFVNKKSAPEIAVKNITNENVSATKDNSKTEKIVIETTKPFAFNVNEKFSFGEWLQLKKSKPVQRATASNQKDIIDNFIALNPRIPRVDKSAPLEVKDNQKDNEQPKLMTETLAKVYVAQKKYDKAIQAYTILSLKYPEKSGFFADQINLIQTLKKQN